MWVSFSTSLSKHKAHIENPKFLTPGGGEKIVVVIVVVSNGIRELRSRQLRQQLSASSVAGVALEKVQSTAPFQGLHKVPRAIYNEKEEKLMFMFLNMLF